MRKDFFSKAVCYPATFCLAWAAMPFTKHVGLDSCCLKMDNYFVFMFLQRKF